MVFTNKSWHSFAYKLIIPISASVVTWSSPCVSPCLSSTSYMGNSHTGLWSILINYDLILTWLHQQGPYFQIRLYSWIPCEQHGLFRVLLFPFTEWSRILYIYMYTNSVEDIVASLYLGRGTYNTKFYHRWRQKSKFCVDKDILWPFTDVLISRALQQPSFWQ